MAISQQYVNLATFTIAATTEYTSPGYNVHPSADGVMLLLITTQAGTANVDFQMADDTWVEVNTAPVAVLANDAVIVDITQKPRAARIRFTPAVAPCNLKLDASMKGVSQPT